MVRKHSCPSNVYIVGTDCPDLAIWERMILIILKIKTGILGFGTIALILVLGAFFPSAAFANNNYQPSPWASTKITIANTAGLMSEDFGRRQFTENITRRDFCELLINSYQLFGYPLPEVLDSHPFTDTQDKIPEQSFMLGLTSGTAEGIFSPDLPLTREMAVVMLGRLRILFQSEHKIMDEQQAEQILQKYAKDSDKLSDWAKRHMADAYSRGIIAGTDIGILSPKDNVTREQAVILALNTLAYSDESRINTTEIAECFLPAPSGIYISQYYQKGEVNLTWGEIPSASAYEVRVYKDGVLAYSARTKNHNLDFRTSSQDNNSTNIFINDRKTVRAVLEVVPLDKTGNPSMFSLRREFIVSPNDSQRVGSITSRSQPRFNSATEALSHMEDIDVPVWQLASGTKKTATITLTVHKDVAEDVKKIFADIYNGEEKFPIKNCYGYSYRGITSTSQHNSGLAIDINPDENYFIGRDGTIKAGKLWKPGENPYSILPDGDVVRAFKKYGWHWSPDRVWSSGADYMHFSLSGT